MKRGTPTKKRTGARPSTSSASMEGKSAAPMTAAEKKERMKAYAAKQKAVRPGAASGERRRRTPSKTPSSAAPPSASSRTPVTPRTPRTPRTPGSSARTPRTPGSARTPRTPGSSRTGERKNAGDAEKRGVRKPPARRGGDAPGVNAGSTNSMVDKLRASKSGGASGKVRERKAEKEERSAAEEMLSLGNDDDEGGAVEVGSRMHAFVRVHACACPRVCTPARLQVPVCNSARSVCKL